jgi:hypothetical protein
LAALTQYAAVSERTLREWIHRAVDPLPAVRIGTKLFVKRSVFDSWMEAHRVIPAVDIDGIVEDVASSLMETR